MPHRVTLSRCLLLVAALLLGAGPAWAQTDTTRQQPIRNIELENVVISPDANISGWLLLNHDIQVELEGAVHNLYDCQFDKAEKQFRSLRRRYPEHPMPYFLMGLSQWWKMMPSNLDEKRYDPVFFAYLDTATTKGEALYKADEKNYEACFFLSASYGFDARLNAERKNWRKATVSSKRALDYLDKSQQANGLSPEFLFGQALMNYYAPWIADNYPLLRPVMIFFPRGNRDKGLVQLQNVATNGFYTGAEAKFFLMKILYNDENKPDAALPIARYMAKTYPNNGYFQRFYALVCYNRGEYRECERVSREILDKLNRGYVGFESISGKYATYFLGALMEKKYEEPKKAAEFYQRCIVFAEAAGDTDQGYYVLAHQHLGRLSAEQGDVGAARRYYDVVRDKAKHDSAEYNEAKTYLVRTKK